MPYYLHNRDVEPTDRQLVIASARYMTTDKHHAIASRQADEMITFVPTIAEENAWRERERAKFRNGTYIRLPFDTRGDHYAHHAIDHPGKIAYTPDDTFGHEDRRLVATPGRYLDQFYAYLTLDEKQTIIGQVKAITTQLRFAITADEIARVYCASSSPTSCMDGRCFERSNSPVRVYGDSDLQCAYLGTLHATDPLKDQISSRAIVWPAEMIYVRIYGDDYLMAEKLKDAGYSHAESFDGARVRVIRNGTRIVAPYVDGDAVHGSIDAKNEWITIGRSGRYALHETNGFASGGVSTCGNCGVRYTPDVDDEDDYGYCSRCYGSQWQCESCDETYYGYSSQQYVHEHGTLCETCHDNQTYDCEYCGTTINEWDYTRRERRDRDWTYCDDCRDHVSACVVCEQLVHDESCKPHGHHDRVCADCRRKLSQSRTVMPKPYAIVRFTCENRPLVEGEGLTRA